MGENTSNACRWDRCKGRTGFTLVELLIVIAIIGVLAALLLPTLANAKAAARTAVCKSNLRQFGIALTMYLGDYRSYPLYVAYSTFGFSDAGAAQKSWTAALEPYLLGHQRMFFCPEWEGAITTVSLPGHATNVVRLRGAYGYNAFGTAVQNPNLHLGLGAGRYVGTLLVANVVSEADVVNASRMTAFGDVTGIEGPISPLVNTGFFPSRRHNLGSNILFCDAHVEYSKQTNLVKTTSSERRKWNNDNQPHPETW